MSSFQRVLCTGLGAECVPIREVSPQPRSREDLGSLGGNLHVDM